MGQAGKQASVPDGISRRDLLHGGLALGATLLLARCGGGEQPTAEAPKRLEKPQSKPDSLVVRAWGDPWSTGIQNSAGVKFTEDTGIEIKFDTSDIGEVHAKVQQAVQAEQRPPVDVVYTIATLAQKAAVQGLVAPLDAENVVTNFSQLSSVGKPPKGTQYVHVYSYTYTPIYVRDKVDLPSSLSWMDIVEDPAYRDSFHMNASYHAILWPFAKTLGIDPTKEDVSGVWNLVEKMRPNICGTGQDVEFIEFVKQGQCSWGVALIGDAFALKDAGFNVGWIVPREGVTLTRDSMYVPTGLPADVTYWAQKFIDYVIDAHNLTDWCKNVATVPTNRKSQVRSDLRGDPAFPFSEEEIQRYAIPEPIDVAARHDDEWQAAYTAALKG